MREPIHAFLGIAPLPAPYGRAAYADATRHFENGQPIGRVQHNEGALFVLERPASIPNNRCQARAFLGGKKRSEPCVQIRTRNRPCVNPMVAQMR
jgi:hypothetical protein